jgi:hypothetical protein
MADVIRVSAPATPPVRQPRPTGTSDPGGWLLLLVPTGICVVMFVLAAWW